MIKVEFKNVDVVEKFIISLPKKIRKELYRNNSRFMLKVKDGAKRRAPVDTGSLKESITLLPVRKGKKVNKWKLAVNSPYGLFQEAGFTPHSFFAGEGFNSSKLAPGSSYFVSKWTPFVKPSLDAEIKFFMDSIDKSMKRSFRK